MIVAAPLVLCIGLSMGTPAAHRAGAVPDRSGPNAQGESARDALTAIAERSAGIIDVTARFHQERHTPLLARPLRSEGTVRVVGRTVRWDTEQPQRSSVLVEPQRVRIYYPPPPSDSRQQGLLEEYDLHERLAEAALSPRFDPRSLREHFDMVLDGDGPGGEPPDGAVALSLVPRDEALKRFISSVHVQVSLATGLLERAELIGSDEERTVVTFEALRTNSGLKERDLALEVPAATRIVRPAVRADDGR